MTASSFLTCGTPVGATMPNSAIWVAARLLESDASKYASGWNFGPLPGNELPVHRVVEIFLDAWGRGSWIDDADPANPSEAKLLRLSIDKALWHLDWRPNWDIHETVQRTVDWYSHYFDGASSMREFSARQIGAYQEAMQQQSVPDFAPQKQKAAVRIVSAR